LKRSVKKLRWTSRVFASVYAVGVESGPLPIQKSSDGKFGTFRRRGPREFDVGAIELRRLDKRQRQGRDAFYKGWVERGFNSLKAGRRIPGQHFIEKAIPASSNASINAFAREVTNQFARLNL